MVTKKDRYSGYFSKYETMTASERRQFQNKKLKQIIAYAYEKAPAIRKKLERAKIKPADLKTVKDLEWPELIDETDPMKGLKVCPRTGRDRAIV